jgi:hypothetical protein
VSLGLPQSPSKTGIFALSGLAPAVPGPDGGQVLTRTARQSIVQDSPPRSQPAKDFASPHLVAPALEPRLF